MKLAFKSTEPILVIDKSKKPWEMNGNRGVVYTALCHQKYDDEVQVEKVRITEEVYNVLEPMKRYFFDATIDIKNSKLEVFRALEDSPVTAYASTPDSTSGSTPDSTSGSTSSGEPAGKSSESAKSAKPAKGK